GYGLYIDAPTGATNNYAAAFATGNVGIGTTSPFAKLQVSGTGTANTLLNTMISEVTGTFTAAQRVGLGSTVAFRNDTGVNYAQIGAYCASDCTNNQSQLGFWTENSAGAFTTSNPPVVISSRGNVGIGTTAPTLARVTGLHINNSAGAAVLRLSDAGTNGRTFEWQSTVVGSTGVLNLSEPGVGNWFTVQGGTGNVGIGTTSPGKTLQVAGPNTDSALVVTTPSSNGVIGTDFTAIDFAYAGTATNKIARIVGQTEGGGGGDLYFQTPTTGVNDPYTTKLEIDRQGFAIFNSTATTSTLSYKGVQVNTTLPASATTWTDVTGLKVNASSLGASSLVTNFYGAYIDQTNLNTHTTGSTIGYGLYINTPAN